MTSRCCTAKPATALLRGCRPLRMIAVMSDVRIELESKVAMLEHTVDALSIELAAHQKRLDFLQANFEAMVQQLKRPRADDSIEPHDTRPPHWGG